MMNRNMLHVAVLAAAIMLIFLSKSRQGMISPSMSAYPSMSPSMYAAPPSMPSHAGSGPVWGRSIHGSTPFDFDPWKEGPRPSAVARQGMGQMTLRLAHPY